MLSAAGEAVSAVPGGLLTYNEWGAVPVSAFKWPAVVALAANILYLLILLSVGRARFKHRVFPPKTAGHPDFDRIFRMQQNYVEQFPSFALAMVLCAVLVNGEVAGLLGGVWVVFRALYSYRYAARHLRLDIYYYTGPQYLAIWLMYLLPVLRIFANSD